MNPAPIQISQRDNPEHRAAVSILTAAEVSRMLRIPLSTIYDLAGKKKIRGLKIGKHWRFVAQDIEEYLGGVNDNFISPKEARV